jgi:ribA/ribD-fused uncharacterized protein
MTTNAHVTQFRGRYFFLSNFYSPAPVRILIGTKWVKCQTLEHGYQASKLVYPRQRMLVVEAATPSEAKALGKQYRAFSYWENVKRVVMLELLRQKFARAQMRDRLLRTGSMTLIEGNWWHDNYWGICECDRCAKHPEQQAEGNWLGRLIMRVREDIS